MQRNHSIDILRCIFAFMVVYLHTHYWTGYPMDLCRCAVPGFMAMTGYFIYSDNQKEFQQRTLKSAQHHLLIYAWSLLLYVFLTIRFWSKNGDFSALSVDTLVSFFFFAETDFLYFGFHLWYLHAVIYALLIIWLFTKANGMKWLVWCTPVFLIANLELFKYCLGSVGSYHLPTYISYGIPYLLIGMGIHKSESFFKYSKKTTWIVLTFIFLVFLYIEGRTLMIMGVNPNNKYISTILLVILLLILCITISIEKETVIAQIGRKYSLDIYVFHNFILFLYYSICDKLPSYIHEYIFKYASPLIIFVVTLLFSIVFRYTLKRFKMYIITKHVEL